MDGSKGETETRLRTPEKRGLTNRVQSPESRVRSPEDRTHTPEWNFVLDHTTEERGMVKYGDETNYDNENDQSNHDDQNDDYDDTKPMTWQQHIDFLTVHGLLSNIVSPLTDYFAEVS